MQENTTVKITREKDIGIIEISGEVTSFSEKILEDAYEEISKAGIAGICLDFRDVTYVNSAGMAIIISILTESRKKDQKLHAFGLTDHFQKIFDMVGITKYMQHFTSREKALAAFSD